MDKVIYSVLLLFLSASSFDPSAEKNNGADVRTIIDKSIKARIDSTLKNYVDSGKIAGCISIDL